MPLRPSRLAPILVIAAALVAPAAEAALPLGSRSLDERRATMSVARGVTWTHYVRGRGTASPWRVDALTIDRRALAGRLTAVLADGRVPGRVRLSAMAPGRRAVVGVNGGYFASAPRIDGDPVGMLSIDGRLVSEPVDGRAALVLPRSPTQLARVARLRFDGAVTLGGTRRLLDGVDRKRGLVPGCGGRGGDSPTQRPSVTLTCTDPSELVLLDRAFGTRTGTARAGVEAVVKNGEVADARRGGNSAIPPDGYVLSGSGDAARFLLNGARAGVRPQVSLTVRAGSRHFDPREHAAIMGAGPQLMSAGRIRVSAGPEAVPPSFSAVRGPRTLAGVRADGRLLLVTIDGRRLVHSLGATLVEAARVMRALGAREALNLDGGGSTTMVVRSRVVNRPSDPGGERPVANGLFVFP